MSDYRNKFIVFSKAIGISDVEDFVERTPMEIQEVGWEVIRVIKEMTKDIGKIEARMEECKEMDKMLEITNPDLRQKVKKELDNIENKKEKHQWN